MHRGQFRRAAFAALGTLLGASAFALSATATAAPAARAHHVYAMTNASDGNEVVVFDRQPNGTLVQSDTVSTDGLGSGAGLGSQGAVVVSPAGDRLYAVNAGSDDISTFSIRAQGLSLVDVTPSGGDMPVSLALHGQLLYALNAGSDDITGFRIDGGGLTELAGSTRPLSGAGVAPAQISFTPRGDQLVVTEKATNMIDTYSVGRDGLVSGPRSHPSEGETPFGFAFQGRHLIVSEAFGGAEGASALSSYYASANGALSPISVSAPDTQTAACWVAVAQDRFAYTTNTGSNSISSYTIAADGSLTLLSAVAGETGDGPIDVTVTPRDRYMYSLNGVDGTISAFQMQPDGSLLAIAGAGGLPEGVTSGISSD